MIRQNHGTDAFNRSAALSLVPESATWLTFCYRVPFFPITKSRMVEYVELVLFYFSNKLNEF